jgi:hypothetical protein
MHTKLCAAKVTLIDDVKKSVGSRSFRSDGIEWRWGWGSINNKRRLNNTRAQRREIGIEDRLRMRKLTVFWIMVLMVLTETSAFIMGSDTVERRTRVKANGVAATRLVRRGAVARTACMSGGAGRTKHASSCNSKIITVFMSSSLSLV